MKSKILKLEEELRQAMLVSDIEKLNELIDDSLVFVAPDGSIVSKQMDLEVHKSGIQKMSQLFPSEQDIQIYNNCAIVTVKMELVGKHGDIDISGDYRYLRVWGKMENNYKILAGSVIRLQTVE